MNKYFLPCLVMLTSCYSNGTVSEQQEIERPVIVHAVPGQQQSVTPVLTEGTLILGTIELTHWLLPAPDCASCSVETQVRYRPDGPDTKIRVTSEGYEWQFINSFRSVIRVNGMTYEHTGPGEVKVTTSGTIKTLYKGVPQPVGNCTITVNWADELPSVSPLYSNDSADTHLQLLSECSD